MSNPKQNQLTATFVRDATKPGKYVDGNGLMLYRESNRSTLRGRSAPESRSAAPTFAEASRIVHEIQAPAISNDRYRRQWLAQLERAGILE